MVKSKKKKSDSKPSIEIQEDQIKPPSQPVSKEEGSRKVVISKYSKKVNGCRSDKAKSKKVKKTKKRNIQEINKSYQDDQQDLQRYFRSEFSGQKAERDIDR
jgi:hypothetical protein